MEHKHPDINQGLYEFWCDTGARLLDVRTPSEFLLGHIPGSRNLPLWAIKDIARLVQDKDAPMYVYCHSGIRSRQAVALLRQLGYRRVKNIGGIINYTGKMAV